MRPSLGQVFVRPRTGMLGVRIFQERRLPRSEMPNKSREDDMADLQRAQSRVIDPNPVPRPYPSRTEQIPMERFRPDADWFGRLMANKYPGVVAEKMDVVQLFDS